MRRLVITLMAVALAFTASAQALAPTSATGGYGLSTSVAYQQMGGGMWEYAYDIYANGSYIYYNHLIVKFEFNNGGNTADHVMNMYDPGTGPELREFWTVNGILGNNGGSGLWGGVQTGVQASYGDLTTNTWLTNPTAGQAGPEGWFLDPTYAAAEGMANPFHSPSDYAGWASNPDYAGGGDAAFGLFAGRPTDWDSDGAADDLFFDMTWFRGGHINNGGSGPQLVATIRIVSDLGPYGETTFESYSSGTAFVSGIVGPGVAPVVVGDLNDDGVVDADDIDLMGDAIRLSANPTAANYDLSDDGVTGGTNGSVDIKDLDYLVRYLVKTSAVNGSGDPLFGTQYGDFNLDGEIELGDLTRLGTYYGVGDKWSEGNANRWLDMDIELGDLTILGTYYGASNGGVDAIPEPMTMSLLAAGACLPLFRRRSR